MTSKASRKRQLAKLRALFAPRKPADDLEDEILLHLRVEEQENLETGMSPDEAHYAALQRFGNVTLAQEGSVEMPYRGVARWREGNGKRCKLGRHAQDVVSSWAIPRANQR